MNLFLWTLQILFALHTAMGGIWKFANSEQNAPSLGAIPHGLWLTLAVLELLAAAALIAPLANKSWAYAAPAAALFVAAEMLLFCGLHVASGAPYGGHVTYWIVVAVVGAFIAYGRLAVRPL